MGRYLPTECHHGTTIDWGDFGPHQSDEDCIADGEWGPDGGCLVCSPPCTACDNDQAIRWAAAVERMAEALEQSRGRVVGADVWLMYVLGLTEEAEQ